MSTVSVPLDDKLIKKIQDLIDIGVADNKASLIRKAIDQYVEDQVVNSILKAKNEARLEGDLDELANKIAL